MAALFILDGLQRRDFKKKRVLEIDEIPSTTCRTGEFGRDIGCHACTCYNW